MNPKLILLPGQLCDEALWAAQRDSLEAIATIAVADLTRDTSIADMASRVLAMTERPFALAGLSMGGYVAFEIMRRAPERVSRLALFNTSARPDTEAQSKRRTDFVALSTMGRFQGVTPRAVPGIVSPANRDDTLLSATIVGMAGRVGREAYARQQQAMIARPDSRPGLAAIRCPTLVVGGRDDRITPPALSEEIASGVPGSRLELLEECGHLAPLEQPEAVNALLRSWLGAV